MNHSRRVAADFVLILLAALHCATSAFALDFAINNKVVDGRSLPYSISVTGPIQKGDFEQLEKLIDERPVDFFFSSAVIYLDSSGGDLGEALKIGTLFKKLRSRIFVRNQCVSACFFVYVMSNVRYLTGPDGRLGVHRPYFDKSKFRELTIGQAQRKYAALESEARAILQQLRVPSSIVEKMFEASSDNIYWLSESEVRSLGHLDRALEELIVASCGRIDSLSGDSFVRCINGL